MLPACTSGIEPTPAGMAILPAASPSATRLAQASPTPAPPEATPSDRLPGWPLYTLQTELPAAPAEMRLYRQIGPVGMAAEEETNKLMAQLKVSGERSAQTGEAGPDMLKISGEQGTLLVFSAQPPSFSWFLSPSVSSEQPVSLSPQERAAAAESFLQTRGLLNFPYLLEPPRLSRERERAVRIVPLIDGCRLYDYDPLNGRLLVLFDPEGRISAVFWRPLQLEAGEMVKIRPAAQAWTEFQRGELPAASGIGQCWQVTTFDPSRADAIAQTTLPGCVTSGLTTQPDYQAATVNAVELVYFAYDLNAGMSPFSFPPDSPARSVFPMWQFSGVTQDGRELEILWPAILIPYQEEKP